MSTQYREPFSKLGQGYFREGREQGIEQGREEGIEQGRKLGLKLGREEGIEQGIEKGSVRTSRKMLRTVFELRNMTLSPDQDKLVEMCPDLQVLEAWIDKAKTAKTPDDIFK